MLDPVDVIIPTAVGGARGRVGLPVGASAAPAVAVVLLDESAGDAAVDRVFTELGIYLQGAGMLVVRAASAGRTSARIERLCTVVGAVAFARSFGAERVAVCMAASEAPGVPPRQTGMVGTAGMVGLAASGARDSAQLAAAIAEVTAAIREAADCIVASATLHVPAADRRPLRPVLADTRAVAPPPCLPDVPDVPDARHRVIPLPRRPGNPRDLVRIISELYTWARAVASAPHAARLVPAAPPNDVPDEAALSVSITPVTHQFLWLEEEWRAIVEAFEQRHPADADRVRMVDREADGSSGVHAVRAAHAAWRTLDVQAQLAWLRACSRGFAFAGMIGHAGADACERVGACVADPEEGGASAVADQTG